MFHGRGGRLAGSARYAFLVYGMVLKILNAFSGAPFRSTRCFEVIMDNVSSNYLEEPEDSQRMVRAKVLEQATVVGAKLEVGFLDKVVE